MAESLFWFPRHSSGCTNQAAQKNVSCLLTGIRSVADRCLCLRNAHIWKILLQFCRAQHLEIPALADPPSTTLVGLPARSKSFSPAGFPSRLLNLQSHLVLTALSVLLTELSGNRNNSSPSRLLQSLWKDWLVHCDSLLLFSFFFSFLSVGVCVRHYLAQRQARKEKGLGCGCEAGAGWNSLCMV